METETIAQAALAMVTLPDDVNFLEAIVLPRDQVYLGRGVRRQIGGNRDVFGRSEPLPLVDERRRFPAGDEAANVFQESLQVPLGDMRRGRRDVRRDDHIGHRPKRRIPRKRLDLKHIQCGAGNFPGLKRGHKVVQIDDRSAADVDEVSGRFHHLEFVAAKELISLGRVRRGNHHEIALSQQIEQPSRRPNFGQDTGNFSAAGIDAENSHSERSGPAADFRPDVSDADHAKRAVGKVQMMPIDFADEGRPRDKIRAARFAADRLPVMVALLVAVQMEVSRETQNKTHHVVGDHIGKQSPACCSARRDARRARRTGNVRDWQSASAPSASCPALEQARSDLSEKRVGVDDLVERFGFIARVNDGHFSGRSDDLRESLSFDGGKHQQLHGASEIDSM